MDGKRLVKQIRLANFLSFGPNAEGIELEPLNIIIGPNSVGKSNFIMALDFLSVLPELPIAYRGGMSSLVWRCEELGAPTELETIIAHPAAPTGLHYRFCFVGQRDRLHVVDESIYVQQDAETPPDFYYRLRTGQGLIELTTAPLPGETVQQRTHNVLPPSAVRQDRSILAQYRDPVRYPELTNLGEILMRIAFYEGWKFDRLKHPRAPAADDLQCDFLDEDAGNLALVLKALLKQPEVRDRIYGRLSDLYERFKEIKLREQGGTIEIQFIESDMDAPVSAQRISDGTLKLLCLAAILCHPTPPPLMCIEEPELGLHPDAMRIVADMLIEASARTQLVVTTHSDALVSALSEVPEAVLVAEHDDDGTHLRRLDPDALKIWLDKYALGDLWRMGELGGTRW